MSAHATTDFPMAAGGAGLEAQPAASMLSGCSVIVGRFLATIVVTLRGTLNADSSAYVAGVLDDLINGQSNLALVFDLRGLRAIDPSGVDALSAAAADVERRGGALGLSGAVDDVLDALVVAGLTGLVTGPEEDAGDDHRCGATGRAAQARAGLQGAGRGRHPRTRTPP